MSDLLDWGPINGSNRHLCCFIGSKAADDRDQIATTKQQKHTETQERDGTGWNDALLNRPPECRHHEQSERPVHRRWDQGLRVQSPGADRREIREVRDIQVSLEKKCVSLVEVLQLDASTSTPSLKVYLYKLGTITLRTSKGAKHVGQINDILDLPLLLSLQEDFKAQLSPAVSISLFAAVSHSVSLSSPLPVHHKVVCALWQTWKKTQQE